MNIAKKTIASTAFLSLVIAGIFGVVQHTSAETGSSTATTTRGVRKEIQDKRQEFKSELKDKRGELKSNIDVEKEKFKSERMKLVNNSMGNSVDRMVERQNKIVEKLSSIADKVTARVVAVKAGGKDTTQVEKHVSDARAQIELAKANILKIPAAVNNGVASTTPKNRFEGLRSLAELIRTQLKSAHTSLGSAVKLLKTLDPKPKATSTPEKVDNRSMN